MTYNIHEPKERKGNICPAEHYTRTKRERREPRSVSRRVPKRMVGVCRAQLSQGPRMPRPVITKLRGPEVGAIGKIKAASA